MKRLAKLKGFTSTLGLIIILAMTTQSAVYAAQLPYDTYNYDYRDDVVYTPAAYVPDGSISGVSLEYNGESIGAFNNPQDMCISTEGLVYLADTGNNRIVVLNQSMTRVEQVITGFDHNGVADTFNQPKGVCVSENNRLYIADSMNKRIVILELTGELVGIVENPTSEVLADDFVFTPMKITVDYADRIYCIAQGMFEGIMVFESSGNFTGFSGTIGVSITLWDKFWRKLATKEERTKQQLFIPTEFTGIDVDDDGFIYASSIDTSGKQAVRRLNPKGQDVIKKGVDANLGGDLWISGFSDYSGASEIIDVVYRDKGIYSILDRKRGRVFTYDHEGNLLYIFGGIGTQAGTFNTPVAIEETGEKLLVLDSFRCEILVFAATEYGTLINDAIALRYDGDEKLAIDKWNTVLKLDENNELANTGIGKAYLTAGDYENAMKYLERGMSRDYYSIAYKRYRNNVLKENLNYIMTGAIVLIGAGIIITKVRKRKNYNEDDSGGGLI